MFRSFAPVPEEESREIYSFEKDKDPQGFKWDTEDFKISREDYRERRMNNFRSYSSTLQPLNLPSHVINESCKFFSFKKNYVIPCEFGHFQLRNNLKVINQEIYTRVKYNTIVKYNPLTKKQVNICTPNFSSVSFDILNDFLLIGGGEGDLLLTTLSNEEQFNYKVALSSSCICNSVKMFDEGVIRILLSNNDHHLRIIDPETTENLTDIECSSCVNHASISKDFNLIAACLDSVDDYVFDRRTGSVCAKLEGHTDYGFCVDWNPFKEYELATGNQDKSVMIWDLRKGNEPVNVLKGSLGSVFNLKYSTNGKYLVCAESVDFLNVYDTGNIKERQVLDFFGDISGFGFNEADDQNLSLFLAIADNNYGSIIELHENSQPSIII